MSEAVDPGRRDDGAPSVGARVQIHSLLRTPEHNGAEGEVVEFDASTGRWRVRLAGPDGRELALKASNLAVLIPVPQAPATVEMMIGAHVEIRSLVRSPELNGVRGQVVEPQDPGTGRCGVKIDSDGRLLALKPANLARLCGNAACRKALAPPLLKCSKCKGEAYCCKACQVGEPGRPRHVQRAAPARGDRVCSLTRARSRAPCLHPRAARPPHGRPGTSTSAARRGRGRRRSSGAPRGGPRAQRPRARRRGGPPSRTDSG
jgi:hypothetical protein